MYGMFTCTCICVCVVNLHVRYVYMYMYMRVCCKSPCTVCLHVHVYVHVQGTCKIAVHLTEAVELQCISLHEDQMCQKELENCMCTAVVVGRAYT